VDDPRQNIKRQDNGQANSASPYSFLVPGAFKVKESTTLKRYMIEWLEIVKTKISALQME
jgi:hypothetical protein